MRKDKITSDELARLCGVSQGTIDRALNNRPGISPKTKQKVLQMAKDHGFIKNQYASSLSRGTSNLIGVVMLNLKNEFFSQLLTSIESTARSFGYTTAIMLSDNLEQVERQCVETLVGMNAAGILLCSVIPDPAYGKQLLQYSTSLVSLGNHICGEIPHIGIDDCAAMFDSTRYVLRHSYDHIYYVSPVLSRSSKENIDAQTQRFKGFEKAMALQPSVHYTVLRDPDTYQSILKSIPANGGRSAVICSSDSYTIQCLQLFKNSDVGIMGFDNPTMLRRLCPQLSTISYPIDAIGQLAVKTVLSPVKEQKSHYLAHTLISGTTIK